MPIKVERVSGQPIILVTYRGLITPDEVKDLFSQSAELMEVMTGHVYRLNDLRDITADFSEVLEMVRVGSAELPGTTRDPRLTSIFVGRSPMARLYADLMRHPNQGGIYIPIVDTMEEAQALIDRDIQRRQQDQNFKDDPSGAPA